MIMSVPEIVSEPHQERSLTTTPTPTTTDGVPAGIKWHPLRKLGATLFPTASSFGKPTSFTCSKSFLAVGTYSADVLLFSYNQDLLGQLDARSTTTEMLGAVTSLSLSADESHLVTGFGLGGVALWELNLRKDGGKLLSIILPSEHGTTKGDGINKFATSHSHLRGRPIITCGVLKLAGTKTFVSVDASGVVIRHKFRRIMLEFSTRSKRVLGDPLNGKPLIDCAIHNNTLALLTPDLLLVAALGASSVDELVSVIFKIPRYRDSGASDKNVNKACVSFYPAKNSRDLPWLLYSWNNHVKLIDLNTHSALAAYEHKTDIEHLDFLTRDFAILAGGREVCVLSLMGESPSLGLENDEYLVVSSPSPPIVQTEVLFQSIFALRSHEFQLGQLSNWADQLLNLLNAGKPAQAIKLALNFYYSECDLSVFGLPTTQLDRRQAIADALPDLVLTALRFGIGYDPPSLKDLMPQAVRAFVLINVELLDSVVELVDGNPESARLFYDELTSLAHSGHLTHLPPNVFKQLVSSNPDPVLFYRLDLSTLDLDLAFKLCDIYQNALSDVKIYLENQALHDYLTPLVDSIGKPLVFRYLSLILTSRVYPIDIDAVDIEESNNAKKRIFDAILFQEPPLLNDLIKQDEELFFDMLNTAFEDSWLNDNLEINRQIIFSFLLAHLDLSSWWFCSFIAENYAKYPQFLAISERVLESVLKTLCTGPQNTETAQLSVLKLLSSYKPRDMSIVIDQLLEAQYTIVLKHILTRSKRFLQLAEIEIDLDESSVWETLAESLVNKRSDTILFIESRFGKLLSFDSSNFGAFVVRHNLTEIWNQHEGNLPFLRAAFLQLKELGGKLPSSQVCAKFVNMLASEPDQLELIEILQNTLAGPNDVELPLVVDNLLANVRIDALTLLLSRHGRFSEALIYVRNLIREKDLTKEDLNKYVLLGAQTCNSEPDVTLSTSMWKQLLDTLVAKNLHEQVKWVTKLVSESTSVSLPEIVKYMLSGELHSDEICVIIDEVFLSLRNRMRTLSTFGEITQRESLQELLKLIDLKKKGWVVSIDSECEICGKKVAGLGIDAQRVYQDWENCALGIKSKAGKIVVYPCKHCYHWDCLERMGSASQCIVCYPL